MNDEREEIVASGIFSIQESWQERNLRNRCDNSY